MLADFVVIGFVLACIGLLVAAGLVLISREMWK